MRYTYDGAWWLSVNIAPEPVKQMAQAMRLCPAVQEMTVTFEHPDGAGVLTAIIVRNNNQKENS